jgi:hypothetical protein
MKRLVGLLAVLVAATLFAASPASAQDGARIHLIHGIPETDVDVLVDGAAVIEGFAFGDIQDISSFAGQTLAGLQVVLAGTEDVAIDAGDVTLPDSGNYSIIAHLDAEGTPTLAVFENDTSAIAAGEGRLTVRHTASAPAVDVLANDAVAFEGLANPNEAAADLPAGSISAAVVPTGETEPVVIGPADLGITDGVSLIVYAVGSLEGGTLQVLTESIEGLGETPAVVETGNSPVEEGSSLPLAAMVALAGALLAGAAGGLRLLGRR